MLAARQSPSISPEFNLPPCENIPKNKQPIIIDPFELHILLVSATGVETVRITLLS